MIALRALQLYIETVLLQNDIENKSFNGREDFPPSTNDVERRYESAHLFFSDKTILTEHKSYYRSLCIFFVFSSSSVVLGDDAMREKLDDDDDVYKELVYISKRCFCVALFCVFVSSNQLFFSQLFRDEINCRV